MEVWCVVYVPLVLRKKLKKKFCKALSLRASQARNPRNRPRFRKSCIGRLLIPPLIAGNIDLYSRD
ncbi:unnamed protein product [Nesidiocoris tenuis]|uniref:Uncharacterized protein n=1 Tax=Nesidiocoris tenuis TaxID=355587 RepID=A0A6H5FV36_9HEMI|nr:unnamed protein product [Nesidiocoris tenuis]